VDGKIAVYFSEQQLPNNDMFLVAHTTSDPASLSAAAVREIHAVDPEMVVYGIRTMQRLLYDSLARQRFSTAMLGAFAAFALLLSVVGIYGVLSHLVAQSTHDIGVRVALGARLGSIVGLVLRQGVTLLALGMVAGLAGATALTRVMSSLLFGVSATDALTFTAVPILLAAVSVAAMAVPARRAAGVDPIIALRDE
jgi:putative ABC transport system permease protein